jgi:hypothetical protein
MRVFKNPDFLSLPDDIGALFDAAGEKSFFNLPGWYALVSRHGLPPRRRPYLIVDNEATTAFVFQMEEDNSDLISCTNPYTCEHDAIAGRSPDPGVIQRLIAEIARSGPRRARIQLAGLSPTGEAFEAILAGLRGRYRTRPFRGWGTCCENVDGKSFKDYLAARSSALTNTWRRKSAALSKTDASFCVHDKAQPLEPFIAAYRQAEQQSWKQDEPFPQFIPELIRFAESIGALRIGMLSIGGETAAVQFWIVWRREALIFKLVHAEKFASFSPGTLLTMHMLEHIFAHDAPAQINFGRGDDAYKKLWVSERTERWGIDAANLRTGRGLMLAAGMAAADLRKSIAGAPARERIRPDAPQGRFRKAGAARTTSHPS